MQLNKESGLTLIEFISLIILFGVLIAITIPKYYSMQTRKANNSLELAAQNGVSKVKMKYSSLLMEKQKEIGSKQAVKLLDLPQKERFKYNLQALDNRTVQLITTWKEGEKTTSGAKEKITKLIELR